MRVEADFWSQWDLGCFNSISQSRWQLLRLSEPFFFVKIFFENHFSKKLRHVFINEYMPFLIFT